MRTRRAGRGHSYSYAEYFFAPLADQLRGFLKIYPQAKWHVYEPINRDNVLEGAKLAFGQPVETRYDFEKADVIVSLDADFLYAGFPGNVRYIRDFAKRRNPDGKMNRLYVIESTMTTTGAKADHRLPLVSVAIEEFVKTIAPFIQEPHRMFNQSNFDDSCQSSSSSG